MTGPPSLRRCLLAAVVAVAVAALAGAPLSGGRASFTWMLPALLLVSGSLLARVEDAPLGVRAVGVVALIPALNLWVSQLLICFDEQRYIAPGAELQQTLMAAASAPRFAGPLLLGAAAGVAALGARAAGGLIGAGLGGALGAQLGRWALARGAGLALSGDSSGALYAADLAIVAGLLAALGAALGAWISRPAGRLSALLLLCGAAMASLSASAPLLQLLAALPSPASPAQVPAAAAGWTFIKAPVPLEEPALSQALLAQGQGRYFPPEWPCFGVSPAVWRDGLRATASIALSADTSIDVLRAALPTLAAYGVTRLSLTGRSEPMGALDKGLGWPGASMILEVPPRDARWVELSEEGWAWMGPEPSGDAAGACAAWAAPGLSVGAAHRALLELQRGEGAPCPGGVGAAWLWLEPGEPRPELGCAAG